MLKERWVSVCLVALFAALPLFGRDWQQCPAVVTITTEETVYALGDTHGDYDRLVALLNAAKLIDGVPASPAQVRWNGKHAVLVVTGDTIDKWNDSLKVIALFRALALSAAAQGGRVVLSAGNHEAEFLHDPHGSKTDEFRKELKAAAIKPGDVARGTDAEGIGKFLLCLPFATRVNDWFFAHAGSTKGRTLTQLVDDLEKGFEKDGYAAKVILGEHGLLEARMNPQPWWEKKGEQPEQSLLRLRGYADALRVNHIVFGHQPGSYEFNDGTTRKKGTMFPKFGALVVLIDMGMSRGVDYSHGAVLRIEARRATALFADGSEREVWRSP